MSIFSKRITPLARQKDRSRLHLPSRVITTNDFGFCLPIFAREVIPGDKWHLDISSFLRLSPLSVPTYADIRNTVRAFYVRFSSVWLPWNDFFAGRPFVYNGQSYNFDSVPTIGNDTIVDFFAKHSVQVTSGIADFETLVRVGEEDVLRGYRFTNDYRRMYSLLLNLGYKINFVIFGKNGGFQPDDTRFSLLPLLCYLRAYYDYYLPSRYTNVSVLRTMFDKLSYDATDLETVLTLVRDTLYCNFDTDYFSASWLNPNSPSGFDQASQQYSFTDPSSESPNAIIYGNQKGSPVYSLPRTQLNQDGLNLLKSAYDWVIRQGLAGQRYFEQIFAQYGIKLPNIQTRRCEFLGSSTSSVMTQDVTSTAATSVNGKTTALGDYAGKGHASTSGSSIELNANDFGMLICIHNIIPDGGYVQGRNREVQHLTRQDYFQPEFDCVGMQAVRFDELYAQSISTAGEELKNHQPSSVFGFLPRYSEYRRPYDNLSGDFVINSRNTGLDSYHSFRLFDPSEIASSVPQNDLRFRQIKPDIDYEKPFSRIFNLTDPSYDHFICVFNIDASVFRYMKTFQTSYLGNLDGSDLVTTDPDCQLH